jgi:membrane protein
MFSEARSFFQHGIWRIRTRRLTRRESFFIHAFRIFILSFRKFKTDLCHLRASALTFYTLLSIVPAMAMALGVAKGFGLEAALEQKLIEIPSHERVMTQIVEFARNLLMSTQSSFIAGVGVAFLVWTVLRVLGQIEQSFNDIWSVKQSRSWARKFSDYLSLVFVCPLLLVLASSLTVYISSQVQFLSEQSRILGLFSPVLVTLLFLFPYMILWALLTFLYIFMPNAKVRFLSAFLGAFVAVTFYQVVQWSYIFFQINVAQFDAVYGSFAAFPLFLIWLQLSWVAVLYGAEIAYAKQYEFVYEMEPEAKEASNRLRSLVAILIASQAARRFQELKEPSSAGELSEELELPACLIQDVLAMLVKAKILSVAAKPQTEETYYQPGRPLDTLTIKDILETLDETGVNVLSGTESAEMEKCRALLGKFWKRLEILPENLNLREIASLRPEEPDARFLKQVLPSPQAS